MNETLMSGTAASPLGDLTIIVSVRGVRALLWEVEKAGRVRVGDAVPAAHEVIEEARRQLADYFSGSRVAFDLPLDPVGTDFQQRAWQALREIPYGETISYGTQARRLGDVGLARAVGAANGRNPISIIVPCHRVIGSSGSMTGYAAGIDAKRFLLDHERAVAHPAPQSPLF